MRISKNKTHKRISIGPGRVTPPRVYIRHRNTQSNISSQKIVTIVTLLFSVYAIGIRNASWHITNQMHQERKKCQKLKKRMYGPAQQNNKEKEKEG
jgi:hypothetical protein